MGNVISLAAALEPAGRDPEVALHLDWRKSAAGNWCRAQTSLSSSTDAAGEPARVGRQLPKSSGGRLGIGRSARRCPSARWSRRPRYR